MSQPSASPSLIVHSIAFAFATGSAPGCARHTGHVCVFSPAPKDASQAQNNFVRVLSWTWISSPITGSQARSAIREPRSGLAQRRLDVAVHLDHAEPVLEGPVRLDQPELALARLEGELEVAHEQRARAVEDAHLPEDAPRRRHELGRGVDERPHRRLLGPCPGPDPGQALDTAEKDTAASALAPRRRR